MFRVAVVGLLLALVGCGGLSKNDALGNGDDDPLPGGVGSGSGGPSECFSDTDCILAASTCCECPTFALPSSSN